MRVWKSANIIFTICLYKLGGMRANNHQGPISPASESHAYLIHYLNEKGVLLNRAKLRKYVTSADSQILIRIEMIPQTQAPSHGL